MRTPGTGANGRAKLGADQLMDPDDPRFVRELRALLSQVARFENKKQRFLQQRQGLNRHDLTDGFIIDDGIRELPARLKMTIDRINRENYSGVVKALYAEKGEKKKKQRKDKKQATGSDGGAGGSDESEEEKDAEGGAGGKLEEEILGPPEIDFANYYHVGKDVPGFMRELFELDASGITYENYSLDWTPCGTSEARQRELSRSWSDIGRNLPNSTCSSPELSAAEQYRQYFGLPAGLLEQAGVDAGGHASQASETGHLVELPEHVSTEWPVRSATYYISRGQQPDWGLESIVVSDRVGLGVVATRVIPPLAYVAEYAGELISSAQARKREAQRQVDGVEHAYVFFLAHGSSELAVDATAISKRNEISRLINHGKKGNLVALRVVVTDSRTGRSLPHIGLFALDFILPGEQLLFDYGERDTEVLRTATWLDE